MSEILTSVDLTHKPGEAYHFLYASQLYGTLFAVYGRFHIEIDNRPENEKLTINRIDLKLINYKGNINLGFSNTKVDKEPFNSLFRPKDKLFLGIDSIYFEVQAMTANLEAHVDLFKPIIIEKCKSHNLIINRVLMPVDGDRFDSSNMDYTLQNPIGQDYDQQKPIFDSEFKYRDGEVYFDKQPQAGMYSNPWTLDLLDTSIQENIQPMIASPRCHQSNVYLVHK